MTIEKAGQSEEFELKHRAAAMQQGLSDLLYWPAALVRSLRSVSLRNQYGSVADRPPLLTWRQPIIPVNPRSVWNRKHRIGFNRIGGHLLKLLGSDVHDGRTLLGIEAFASHGTVTTVPQRRGNRSNAV